MQPQPRDSSAPLLGREEQLKSLESFLDPDGRPRALVLAGDAGIGKTTLWKAGIPLAHDRGFHVLSARAGEAETTLSFSSVSDLLDGIDLGLLPGLPGPQRTALEVALRRVEPTLEPPDPFAIPAGLLNAIRILAARKPLLVAVDDVAYTDGPSANALAYAARRLHEAPVRFLFTRRGGRPSALERAFDLDALQTLEVGPLSFGAISHLITQRLARPFPRRVLRQIFETSQGNPLFAYELGRALLEQGVPEIGGDLPVPDVLEDLFRAEVASLPANARRAMLAVALSGELAHSELAAVVDPSALHEAVAAGLLAENASRLSASHPLLAAAARRQSSSQERRGLHRDLAAVVTDPALQARHLALAASAPDAEVAGKVGRAAEIAFRRGGIRDAIDLEKHALALTPAAAPERLDRVLTLAHYLQVAGDTTHVTRLLTANLESFPHGPARATAHLILGAAAASYAAQAWDLERATEESVNHPAIRARVLIRMSALESVGRVSRIAAAEELAIEALADLGTSDAEIERQGLVAVAWARILGGRPIDDLMQRMPSSPIASSLIEASIARPAGVQMAFRGEVSAARAKLSTEIAAADARGEGMSTAALHLQLCELALRTGEVKEASRLFDEWDLWFGLDHKAFRSKKARVAALLAAIKGESARAKRLAAEVLDDLDEGSDDVWSRLEASRARGVACLFDRDTADAIASLKSVWDHTVREGVNDPGAFPVAPDLVEALVETGRVEVASQVTERLRRLATEQAHPWGIASAKRCEAILVLAESYDAQAADAMTAAAAEYGRLGLKFDRARTLLVLGRMLRRFKKRSEARRWLEAAVTAFEQNGSSGWADQARSELARVSGRRSADGRQLTSSEQRVASLAARGLSNKEIARRLFVTVYTVEAHLSHAYAKLGVRSRAGLAHHLANTI